MMTTKLLIENYKRIYNDQNDYSKTIFTDKYTKVKIICKKHGIFSILPYSHYKNNCPKCSIEKKYNDIDDILNRFKNIHGDKFDYSKVEYKGMHSKIKIRCKRHDFIFEQ